MKTVLFSLVIMTLVSLSSAETNSLTKLLTKVETTPVEMKFDLKIFWAVREKEETKKGHLYLNGNDNSFNITLGTTQWISDAITVWQYSSRSDQVLIQDFLEVNLSMHPSTLFETFKSKTFTLQSKKGKLETYHWKSTIADDEYKDIIITIDSKKESIKSIIMTDSDDNKSTYTFNKVSFTKTLEEKLLTFTPTEDMYVIDNR